MWRGYQVGYIDCVRVCEKEREREREEEREEIGGFSMALLRIFKLH